MRSRKKRVANKLKQFSDKFKKRLKSELASQEKWELFKQLACTDYRSNAGLTKEEIVDYLKSSNSIDLKSACFLGLIKVATLDELKQFSSDVNMDFADRYGLNAVLTACTHDRQDVLQWLVQDKNCSLECTDKEGDGPVELAIFYGHRDLLRFLVTPIINGGMGVVLDKYSNNKYINPLLRAAAANQIGVIRDLVTPIDEGGYGLSLINAHDHLNNSAVEIAAEHGNWEAVCELLKPQKLGGFGVQIASPLISNFPYDKHRKDLNAPGYIMLVDSQDDTREIGVINTHTWLPEVYRLESDIASGSFGGTTLFSHRDKRLVLKRPHHTLAFESFSDFDAPKRVRREYKFLCKAYPEFGPYSYQMMRSRIKGYDLLAGYIVMPKIDGKDFADIPNDLDTTLKVAQLFLATARQVNYMHERKQIVHGDLTPGNIMAAYVEGGGYDVRLIDFYFAQKIGKPRSLMGANTNKHAPELRGGIANAHPSQDVWTLAATFTSVLRWLSPENAEDIRSELSKSFPAIEGFCDAARNIVPQLRQPLPDFIHALEQQIYANTKSASVSEEGIFSRTRARKRAKVAQVGLSEQSLSTQQITRLT